MSLLDPREWPWLLLGFGVGAAILLGEGLVMHYFFGWP